ncbi:MAG: hypothetical protein HOV81_17835 [Kofleriaceae bacterium]|nr:hypothetical protein [Kofleriaceae bacterium]
MRAVLASIAMTGCWGVSPPRSPDVKLEAWYAPTSSQCPADTRVPVESSGATVRGALSIESVAGEQRLWTDIDDETAWSTDGSRIAVAGYGSVAVWTKDGRFVTSVPGTPFPADGITWSTDDRALLLQQRRGHAFPSTVVPLSLKPTGPLSFVQGMYYGIQPKIATATMGRSDRATVEFVARPLTDADLLSDGEPGWLYLRTDQGCFSLGPGRTTDVLTFSADGASVFVVHAYFGSAPALAQYSTRDGALLRAFHARETQKIVASPIADRAYLLVPDGLRVVDLASGRVGPLIPAPWVDLEGPHSANHPTLERPGGYDGVVYASKDGHFLLGESKAVTQAISTWYVGAIDQSKRAPIGRSIERIAVSPDERLYAIGATDGTVEVRDRRTNAIVGEVRHDARLEAVAFSDAGRLASASADGVVRVATTSGKVIGSIALKPDRARLLSWRDASTLVVDTRYGQTLTVALSR